jgi:MFS family permease
MKSPSKIAKYQKYQIKEGLMELNKKKLFNKNFIIVVLGQLISIFANSILRFALPLYILDKTGSTAIFGSILAAAAVPPILFSPLGGILADRYNRKNIMVTLDFFTAFIIAGFSYLLIDGAVILVITVLMIMFSIIQSFYQPAVQASIPVIAAAENLEQANGIVSLVNAVSNLFGPVAAGILYGIFGIKQIMLVSFICFSAAAVMEMFIVMKFKNEIKNKNVIDIIKSDIKVSLDYIRKDKPIMLKTMLIISGINLFLTSMIIVGLPAMIKINLGLSSQLYGLAEGAMAAGMIAGGIFISASGKKIAAEDSYKMLSYASLGLVPIAAAFTLSLSVMTVYYIILLSCFEMMFVITIFSIVMMSFVQRETPDHLIGKVISYILVLTQCTLPFGQALYGFIFEKLASSINIIVLVTAICSFLVAVYSKNTFRRISETNNRTVYAEI